jgi:hypothetical protein
MLDDRQITLLYLDINRHVWRDARELGAPAERMLDTPVACRTNGSFKKQWAMIFRRMG